MSVEGLKEAKLPRFVIREMKKRGSKHIKSYDFGECAVIVSQDDGKWHYSMSHATRLPTFNEVMRVKESLLPNVSMEIKNVNQKPNYYSVHVFEV